MRTRTGSMDALPAARSNARLIHIMPQKTLSAFDAPVVLTTATEITVLHVLAWAFIAIWLLKPAEPPPSPSEQITSATAMR